ncbi:ATF5 factor, partial [Polyodon spathula]|nr:ATF5 factor [Polyodon spathula]
MMAMSSQWKIYLPVCQTDALTLSLPQASCGQSQGRRGEGLVENPHLIGDGLSDWMTEKVDFSFYVPPPSSHFSAPHPDSSLHSSSTQHDPLVPSDLEVMTSLLQEELAQLEDYFLSESEKPEKCEKPLQTTAYQLPYHCHQSGQSDASPLLVTLATEELDLLSFCSGPTGRPKIPRPAPYSYNRPTSNNNNNREAEESDHLDPEDAAGPAPKGGAKTVERKQKKKEQNKTAAHSTQGCRLPALLSLSGQISIPAAGTSNFLRSDPITLYRLRKREELGCQEEELRGLERKNQELKDKAESVEREIQYVKDLLIEVYKARSQRLKQGSSA